MMADGGTIESFTVQFGSKFSVRASERNRETESERECSAGMIINEQERAPGETWLGNSRVYVYIELAYRD